MATNNYLAQGGSGYVMLRRNTTQQDSGIPQRDAAIDRIRKGEPCVPEIDCRTDAECLAADRSCACPGRWWPEEGTGVCMDRGGCSEVDSPEPGRCVLTTCLDEVALLYARNAASDPTEDPARTQCRYRDVAGIECAAAACVNADIGAVEDGRIRAYLP